VANVINLQLFKHFENNTCQLFNVGLSGKVQELRAKTPRSMYLLSQYIVNIGRALAREKFGAPIHGVGEWRNDDSSIPYLSRTPVSRRSSWINFVALSVDKHEV
jgi:hypothetical protein